MSSSLPVLDKASHKYILDGVEVPGVTKILAPLVNLHMVNADVLSAAANFGNAVHKACELDDLGALEEESLDPALTPYLSFSNDYGVEWSLIEACVYNAQMGYAGTVDRYGTVRGVDCVVDLKSSAILYPTVGPQLAAYAKAIPEHSVLTKRIGVLLKPNGAYEAKVYTSATDWAVFASLLTVRNFCLLHNITPNFKELTR